MGLVCLVETEFLLFRAHDGAGGVAVSVAVQKIREPGRQERGGSRPTADISHLQWRGVPVCLLLNEKVFH